MSGRLVDSRRRPMKTARRVIAAWTLAATPGVGAAHGTLTVNGKSVSLGYAYASFRDALYVLVSDVPVDASLRRKPEALREKAQGGALHAIEVRLDDHLSPAGVEVFEP